MTETQKITEQGKAKKGRRNWLPTANREYKSRIFTMLYSEPERALELYNAVNNTNYDNPELLEINTLENAIYMGMKNDVSFVLDARMSLYEHQSTVNPNLPLRFLLYVADVYSGMLIGGNQYSRTKMKIPEPRFLIFYNGQEEQPDRQMLHLSDLYITKSEKPALELEALMLNVNMGHNQELMAACRTLREYAEYVDWVRRYAKEMPLDQAVDRAIDICIHKGILAEFLEKNKAEVKKVSIYEYDEEEHMRMEREESWQEGKREGEREGLETGRKEGRKEGIKEGRKEGRKEGMQALIEVCLEFGQSPEDISVKLTEKFQLSREEAVRQVEEYFGIKI